PLLLMWRRNHRSSRCEWWLKGSGVGRIRGAIFRRPGRRSTATCAAVASRRAGSGLLWLLLRSSASNGGTFSFLLQTCISFGLSLLPLFSPPHDVSRRRNL